MFGLEWKGEITVGDLLTALGSLATLAGLIFAGWQFRRSVAVERARFLLDLAQEHLSNNEVRELFYRIDHETWTYDSARFHNSKDEQHLDALLYHFDLIGRLVKSGVLTRAEALYFIYDAHRVLHNPEVKKYLAWMDSNLRLGGQPYLAVPEARYLADLLLSSNSSR